MGKDGDMAGYQAAASSVQTAQQAAVPETENTAVIGIAAMQEAHSRGECKPCAYFMHKADGCRQGNDCQFCHLCDKGEGKKRRKEMLKKIRENEKLIDAPRRPSKTSSCA